MFLNIEDKLYILIRYKEFKLLVIFLDVSVEAINNFFYFYKSNKNQIFYLNKIINKNKNVFIRNIYKDTRQ